MRVRLAVMGVGIGVLCSLWAIGLGHRASASTVLSISFVSSPEKAGLIRPLVDEFNSSSATVDGRHVVVDLQIVNSGDAETEMAGGELRPVVWSPASSLWGRLLDFEAGQDWVPSQNPSIVRTPLLIAMWEPLARKLGWPHSRIGFREVIRLATSGQRLGRFGRFKYAHTDPYKSTAGLEAVAAEYYAASGKRPLTAGDVGAQSTRHAIRNLERSIVQYGDTTLYFQQQLPVYGPSYASAVAMEETTLVATNQCLATDRVPPCPPGVSVHVHGERLVGLYPPGGTFFSDDPFIILDAPWVIPAERDAALSFRKWLMTRVTPALAAKYGFRPSDLRARLMPPLDSGNGVDPIEPRALLALPAPPVLAAVRSDWEVNRKAANVALVVDTSGSMGAGGRSTATRQALDAFINELPSNYRVRLLSFGDQAFVDTPMTALDEQGRMSLQTAIGGLTLGGEHALYDATNDAVAALQHLDDRSRINAAIVLTDGGDTSSQMSLQGLLATLQAAREPRLPVVVYTIALGGAADQTSLKAIALASEGNEFSAGTGQLESTYNTIASYL